LINETKLLLAETQLELARPEPALASLAQIVSTSDELNRRADEARVTSLLWLNRIEEARNVEVGAETWLAAIDLFDQEPHAPQVASATLESFGDVLQPEERSRLTAVAQLAASQDEVQTDPGG
ncbi:MAG: hypothetical protein AAFY46_07465, partial [Planctomycetota bacterium]